MHAFFLCLAISDSGNALTGLFRALVIADFGFFSNGINGLRMISGFQLS
jgi:hypothetical protein